MNSDMKKNELKVGMKVRVNEKDPRRLLRGKEVVITSLVSKDSYVSGVVHAEVEGLDEEYAFWPSELDPIEVPKEYTLHGRPVKEGDRVYYLPTESFYIIASYYPGEAWTEVKDVINNPQDYAWDVPPVVDLSTIPPPLCFIDGLPVRVGSIMYHKSTDTAVTVCGPGFTFRGHRTVEVLDREGMRFPVGLHILSWDFPNTPPTPKKVRQVRTRWYNIYEHDATRTSYSTFNSKEEAKKYALQGCIGQGSFKYELVGPEAQK
jgi:hypothetical protein